MVEWLAIPATDTPPIDLSTWADRMEALGHKPTVERDGAEGAWLEVAPLKLRGYAVFEGENVEAINFELHAPDPTPALDWLKGAADGIGWELYPDDDEEEDEE
jgi:hypothetical protein